jgi:hypothetical protein
MKRGHKFQMRAAMRDGHPPHQAVKIAEEMRRQSAGTGVDSPTTAANPDYMGGPPDSGNVGQLSMKHGGMTRRMADGGVDAGGDGQINPETRRRAMDEYVDKKTSSMNPGQDSEFSRSPDPDKRPRTQMKMGGMKGGMHGAGCACKMCSGGMRMGR